MDAIQTTMSDVGKFLSGNTIYTEYQDYWQFLFESYIGGEEYRNAGHLVKYINETAGEYASRLRTTPLQNHCNSVISVYNSFLFRTAPTRSFETLDGMTELEDFLYDSDMDGRSFNSFMKDVATNASIFGHCWIIVAKPNVGATTRAAEMAQGVRPYVNLMTPLTVLDWSWQRSPNGRYTLDYFKYIEDINGDIVTVREWTPEIIRTTIVDRDRETMIETIVEDNGLGKIPAVIAYNKRSIIRGIGISDIADIADAQKFIYNATSEIDQSIRMDSHPSLVKTGETLAGVGAGAIIQMPDNMDPGLKPYILDHSGASVEKILQTIEATVQSIDKMANTGAVRATSSRSMSGVAMETEFQLLNARLSEKGDSLELAEEQIWRLWAEYMNQTWQGKVEYPNSFNLRDAQNDLDMYLKATTTTVNSPTFKKELQKQIAKTIVDDELALDTILEEIDQQPTGNFDMSDMVSASESQSMVEMEDENEEDEGFEIHIMMDPQTGEMLIAKTEQEHEALAARGWVHI